MSKKTTTQRRKHFESLISEAEELSISDPQGYRRKVTLLAMLGYGYLFGIIIFFILLFALMVYGALNYRVVLYVLVLKKLGLVLLVPIYGVIKALCVKVESPDGYKVTKEQCPELFHELISIQKQLKSSPIHEVILYWEFNAYISQVPRIGVLGWNKNVLGIGLPLLLSLNTDQMRSVLAHEFGHMTKDGGRLHRWVYRIRTSWLKVMDAFENGGMWSELIFGRFFNWYAPYFNAYSFALARASEYEADSVAAKVTSPKIFVGALGQIEAFASLLDNNFWKKIMAQADKSPSPYSSVFSLLYKRLKKYPFDKKEISQIITKALSEKTGHYDTHPSLSDRIKPLSSKLSIHNKIIVSAADAYLGKFLPNILKDFDKDWREFHHQGWRERYDYVIDAKKQLAKLEEKKKKNKLSDVDMWNLAYWTEQFKPEIDSLVFYHAYWKEYPNDADGKFAIGRILLSRGNEKGISFIESAMKANHHYVIPGCDEAYGFYKSRNIESKANKYLLKSEKYRDLQNESAIERSDLKIDDEFMKHDLSNDGMKYLEEQLSSIKKFRRVWICRKKVRIFEDISLYVLIFEPKSWWFPNEEKLINLIIENMELPGECFIIMDGGSLKKIAKKALLAAEQII